MTNQNYTQKNSEFAQFILVLKAAYQHFGFDFDSVSDTPNFSELTINTTFEYSKEKEVDTLIRYIRDHVAGNYEYQPIHQHGRYPISVLKIHIPCVNYWSVEFSFSKEWELQERFQALMPPTYIDTIIESTTS